METIRVNMTPCEDIKTIHASQNDNEAREWGFELHNNGEKIDSSSISDQLVFKAYENGTEQILPENGSTPTTSPFKGDIKYPQGLLSDQEFLYRESPAEEDGLAWITDIKGNTLVWNQLIQNGNFADGTNNWSGFSNTTTVSNNKATVKCINTTDQFSFYPSNINLIQNHKYLITFKITLYGNAKVSRNKLDNSGNTGRLASGVHAWIEAAFSSSALGGYRFLYAEPVSDAENDYYTVENAMIFDLTKMGLDISSPSGFTSLFPLPYYSYNQGSLLSFNGNGIKTVGFNQWDEEWEVGSLNDSSGLPIESAIQIRSKNYCPCISGLEYYFHSSKTDGGSQNIYYFAVFFYDVDKNFVSRLYTNRQMFRVPTNASYFKLSSNSSVVVYGNEYLNDICINISSSKNGTYEPYTSSTLSLPISTYFPSGMKSAGNVYDELTESKAITRIGSVDLGSLNWIHRTEIGQGIFSCEVTSTVLYKRQPSVNFEVAQYNNGGTVTGVVAMVEEPDKTVCVYHTGNTNSRFIYAKNTAYSDATAFKSAMSGVYLYYELATPTETSFTTASLVTENAEIPLSNEDGVLIGKCTEELSENPGFFDAKIKLSDSDGDVYSNKIQLHVERKPS